MKENLHPKYQDVLFIDSSTGRKFVCGSTAQSDKIEEFEGKKYPAIHVAISSSSHPYFVGGKKIIDTEGRVDRFTNRYKKAAQQKAVQQQAAQEAAAEIKPAAKRAKKKA
jgi:large subunit ribosomal protein L31